MKKFLVQYNSSQEGKNSAMDPALRESMQKTHKAWMEWKERAGDKVIDFTPPIVSTTRVKNDGSTENSSNKIFCYTIMQAADLEELLALLKDHPHLKWRSDSEIEIHEYMSF